jgi:hypothetical protein
MEQRALIRFFTLKGQNSEDIHTQPESVCVDEAPCIRTVYKWHKRFANGRRELFEDPRSGRRS